MKRPKHVLARSFEIFACDDPNCGPHLVALDKNGEAICEMVIARRLLPHFIAELQRQFPPPGGSGELH